MNIDVTENQLTFFQCLSSKTRLQIIDLVREQPMNIGELSEAIGVSSTIIARHVSMLEKASILTSKNIPGKRGIQKQCELHMDQAILNFHPQEPETHIESLSIPVGHYKDYEVNPTCGMASKEQIIGMVDDPRYFSNPLRTNASILWFKSGFVTYSIPSYLFNSQVSFIEISFEICSEYPGYNNDYPSDIQFYINDTFMGQYKSPGDFGDKPGAYTPSWWSMGTQYGLLKTIRITEEGTFIDGEKIGEFSINQIQLPLKEDLVFKISAPEDSPNNGGITLFGEHFGNYNQDILIRVSS